MASPLKVALCRLAMLVRMSLASAASTAQVAVASVGLASALMLLAPRPPPAWLLMVKLAQVSGGVATLTASLGHSPTGQPMGTRPCVVLADACLVVKGRGLQTQAPAARHRVTVALTYVITGRQLCKLY